MEHLTPPQEVGTLKHWLKIVRDHMTCTNIEDEPEEDAIVTEVEETASTFSFPSTLPSGPSDGSAALKPPKPPIAAQVHQDPCPSDAVAKPAAWRFQRRLVADKLHFSVSTCPDVLAAHVAWRCAFNTVVDLFCGVGRLAVRLARTYRKMIAVDNNPAKIRLALRKAVELGVAHRIEFRIGDCFAVLPGVTSDAVITSPPWAAPAWDRNRRFSAEDLCSRQKGGLAGILEMAREIAPRVVLHVPKTIHIPLCNNVYYKHTRYVSI
ncbi:trimethylguanosine synthase-like [Sipha flava]|uniref:Trimethylguanosine synthase n=1 Tax=Sipha flava TaxID=143950 RepID=A0A8B8GNT2_9HEMI|nr:trimethylguanosine synthase-like [Sipha flava]